MANYRLVPIIALLLYTTALAANASEEQARIIQRAKKATALVNVASHEFGTAFCIDASGLYVTDAHVIKNAAGGGKILLVMQPGEAEQKVVTARIVRMDVQRDLALLAVKADEVAGVLELGSTDELQETAPVTTFGYPFGKLLAERDSNDYPSITVSTGHVTSLRKLKGKLEHVQLDASLNPGNSGGPVLDGRGKVIGIVQAGIFGSGVNLAIPVEKLNTLLETPEIAFDPPEIAVADASQPHDYTIRVVLLRQEKSAAPVRVKFSITGSSGPERVVEATGENGTFHARIAPIAATQPINRIQFTAVFPGGGSISGWLPEGPIHGSGRDIKLSELRRIELDRNATLTLADGSVISGPVSGLGPVDVDLGGLPARVDLSKAMNIQITAPEIGPGTTTYKITVTQADQVVGEASGILPIKNAPPVAPVPGNAGSEVTAASDLPQVKVEVKLPGPVEDVVVGGGGKYLFLLIAKLNKLAVFDVGAAKVIQYLTVPSADLRIAAGADKLVVVVVDQKVIQRWDLLTMKSEATMALPLDGTVMAIAMGSNSHGPLLVRWTGGTSALDRTSLTFLDLQTFKPIEVGLVNPTGYNGSYRDTVHMRASANGDVFGLWNTSSSPSGMTAITLIRGKAQTRYLHGSYGFVVPGPDGNKLFTGESGVFDVADLHTTVGPSSPRAPLMTLPANVPGYYLSFPISQSPRESGQPPMPTGSVCIAGDNRPLVALPELPEMPTELRESWIATDFTMDKRIYFFPVLKRLVVIPSSNDLLAIRTFNVFEALDHGGIDYLFVTSIAPHATHAGEIYRYPIEVRSKRGGVTFKLEGAPEGMTISSSGLLTWQVPPAAGDVSVVVNIHDSSGQEVFHTFVIHGD